ncbi:DEAD/DEAH box helicase family protein [soil metagenome]
MDRDQGEEAARDPEILYRHGLAVLRHVREGAGPGWMSYDPRSDALIAPGHRFPELRAWGQDRGIAAGPEVEGEAEGELPFFDPRTPRPYQQEAVMRWQQGGGRGSVILPTGAGKSFVAVLAIHGSGQNACVVAPTRALVGQWFAQLADAFGAQRVGAFYSDEKEVREITVTTYHSAFTLLERWGGRFDLLVLDEAHHLANAADGSACGFHDALRIAPAALRLGLTATYPDGRDDELRRLVGPVVYRRTIGEMTDAELAAYVLQRRFVALTPDERSRYDRSTALYDEWFSTRGYRERYPDAADAWRVFMAETRRSPAARRAFRAFLERERIVALCEAKLNEAERLLRLFPAETVVLFCGRSDAAERVSRRLAIPMISADTPASERKVLLDAVAAGEIRALASVQVLDEGWDVPTAKLGIVLGDSTRGGTRQHTQRLGRLLRRQGDRVASLFEIVASDTHEFFASQKRRSQVRRPVDGQLGLGF